MWSGSLLAPRCPATTTSASVLTHERGRRNRRGGRFASANCSAIWRACDPPHAQLGTRAGLQRRRALRTQPSSACQCVPGGLDGPFDPEGRCANWWHAGRCQWGPLCRQVDPVVPASGERTDPYHHPAPYDYRSCPATGASSAIGCTLWSSFMSLLCPVVCLLTNLLLQTFAI